MLGAQNASQGRGEVDLAAVSAAPVPGAMESPWLACVGAHAGVSGPPFLLESASPDTSPESKQTEVSARSVRGRAGRWAGRG